jgi:epoxide hydrolase 4
VTRSFGEALGEHHFVDLEDVRLHFVQAGDSNGPLVILLHGFPEFWYSWRYQIPHLAEMGFCVIAPDMRGYNLSSKPAEIESYDSDYLSRDVAALIQHMKRETAIVVGHDWGAAVAWYFAMRYPQMLSRLVIMNGPHPNEFPRQLMSPSQILKSLYMFIFQVPGLGERLIAKNNYARLYRLFRKNPVNPLTFSSQDIERYIEAAARPGALTAMLNYYRAAARALMNSKSPAGQSVKKPVLVIWGQQDTALGPQCAYVRPSLATDLEMLKIEGCSHWVQLDRAAEVNKALREFLKSEAPQATNKPTQTAAITRAVIRD